MADKLLSTVLGFDRIGVLVSYGGNGAADSGKVLGFLSTGGIRASADSGPGVAGRTFGATLGDFGLYAESANGVAYGLHVSSVGGVGGHIQSHNGITGLRVVNNTGTNIAEFWSNFGGSANTLNIKRSTMILEWKMGGVLGSLVPTTLTGARTWNLPDATGTIALTSNQTFTNTILAGTTNFDAANFAGQVEMPNQLATLPGSAMTKSLVDAFNHSDDEVVRHMLYTPKVTFSTYNYYTVSTTVAMSQGDSRLALTTSATVNAGGGRQVFFSNCSGSIQYPQNFILCVTLIGHITADNDWMHVGNFSLTDASLYSVTSPHYIGTNANEGRFMVQMRKKVGANLLEARVVWKTTAGVYNEGAWVDIGANNYHESPKFLILRATGGTNRTINAYVFHGTAPNAGKPNTYKLSDATLVGTVAGITGQYAGYPHALSCGFVTPSGVAQTIAFSNLLTSQ